MGITSSGIPAETDRALTDVFLSSVSVQVCLPCRCLAALTSYVQRRLPRHRLAPALAVQSGRLSSVHRQVHHPVEGHQLDCVKLPVVHRLSAARNIQSSY